MRYILVTGGVISGVGKGIIASSLGVILQSHGFRVSAIKIDPYINIDAGTFSPYEHGEVFVLDDGGEVDLDLGNYERFLGLRLRRSNNITTGKIYKQVIDKERHGEYLGKTVQVIPHITDAIQDWVENVAQIPVDDSEETPNVCIVELGGTIGDIEGMPFVEAFRQFQFRVRKENFLNVHVSLIPEPRTTGEQKTKPTQNSVRELRGLGLIPDLIVCRSATPIADSVKRKVSTFCDVEPDKVICVHDAPTIYRVPLMLEQQGVLDSVLKRLNLTPHFGNFKGLTEWEELADECERMYTEVHIAMVGKYVECEDAYTSVIKALEHASLAAHRKLVLHRVNAEELEENTKAVSPARYHEAWHRLTSAKGVLVPGGFGVRGARGKILACQWARTKKIAFLGVCLGMQCAVVDFARNVLRLPNASSTEFARELSPEDQVVVDMPEHSASTHGMGATMRLGRRTTLFLEENSILRELYGGKRSIDERHRHRYEVNPRVIKQLDENGMKFVGVGLDEGPESGWPGHALAWTFNDMRSLEVLKASVQERIEHMSSGEPATGPAVRMEVMELADHPYFVGVQFHPEYLTHPLVPSPAYFGLILAASGQLRQFKEGRLKTKKATTNLNGPFGSRGLPIPQLFNGFRHHNGLRIPNGCAADFSPLSTSY